MNKSASVVAALLLVSALPSAAKDWLLINGKFPLTGTNVVITETTRTNSSTTTSNILVSVNVVNSNTMTTNTVVVTNQIIVTNVTVTQTFATNTTIFSNTVSAVFDFVAAGTNKARATLTTTNLLPGTNYEFVVGGALRTGFAGNVRGKANLVFQNFPGKAGLYQFPLPFDPRDQVFAITNKDTPFLTLTVGTSKQTPGIRYQESTDLDRIFGTGTAEASYDQTKLDLRTFRISLKGVSAGTYDVWVGGQPRGSFVAKGGSGKIVFDYPFGNNDVPLNFDPRGKNVQVVKGGVSQFSRTFRALLGPPPPSP